MADTSVAITAGSGTSVDTRTESTNGNHRQVVVLGDPSTNAGVAPVDAASGLKVDLGADNDVVVTNAGTFATQVDGAALTSLQLIDDTVYTDGTGTVTKGIAILGQDGTNPQAIKTDASGELQVDVLTHPGVDGTIAHDAADSGAPVKVGAKAESAVSTATMVADGDRTDVYADIDGVLLVRNSRPLGDVVSERVSNTDGASTAFTNFAATASTRNVITGYSVYNASATAGYVDFRDGTGGSVLWTVPLPATGGANFAIPDGIFRTTANTALAYDVSAALTTVYISVTGFKSKV